MRIRGGAEWRLGRIPAFAESRQASRTLSRGGPRSLIAVLIGMALVIAVGRPADAASPQQVSVGQMYADGLDSRLASTSFADMSRQAGYASYGYTTAQTADDAWSDGLSSAMLGLFGHANAGIFQTADGPTVAQNQILGVGPDTDVLPSYTDMRLFSEYLPFLDVDDLRLLVVAGCHTAGDDPWLGSWTDLPVRRGVDAVVTFPELVYYPSSTPGKAIADTNYSGNYFWNRFSYHFGSGAALGVALARARTDLLAKEGTGGGWDGYQVHGSVANPAGLLLRPASSGQPWTSNPLPTPDFIFFSALTPTRVTETTGPTGDVVRTVETAEGVSYRQAADGAVLDAVGVPTTTGAVTLSEAAAASRADRFLDTVLASSGDQLSRIATTTAAHGEGQQVVQAVYRTGSADRPGARQVVVEVDRRSGAVVYFADVRGAAADAPVVVPADEAIATARQHTGLTTATATAVADSWDTSRWIVTLDAGESGRPGFEVPDVTRVIVDATTGAVLRSETS
jgi:hypothetical protein